ISPVMMKNVPGRPRSFMSGIATRNWLMDESSYVMERQASFPSCHLVTSDPDDCAHSGVAMRSVGMTPIKTFFLIKLASETNVNPYRGLQMGELFGGDRRSWRGTMAAKREEKMG